MEPSVEKLSEDVKEIRGQLDGLREKLQTYREKDLFDLRRQVEDLGLIVRLIKKIKPAVAAVVGILFLIATFLGLSVSVSSFVSRDLDEKAKSHVKRLQEEAQNQLNMLAPYATKAKETWDKDLYSILDWVTLVNGDVERSLNELSGSESKKMTEQQERALSYLQKVAKTQIQREYVFSRYVDVCLQKELYSNAYKHLEDVEKENIFPDGFRLPSTFINAAFICWIQSLKMARDYSDRQANALLEKAWTNLKLAKEKAGVKDAKFYGPESLDAISPQITFRSFFIRLSEGYEDVARDDLKDYLSQGKTINWSFVTGTDWFNILVRKRPRVRDFLKEECKATFPDGITTRERK